MGDWHLGASDCSQMNLRFANPAVGMEANLWSSKGCCFVELTKVPTAVGETIEGTFSGVVQRGTPQKLRITNGAFPA